APPARFPYVFRCRWWGALGKQRAHRHHRSLPVRAHLAASDVRGNRRAGRGEVGERAAIEIGQQCREFGAVAGAELTDELWVAAVAASLASPRTAKQCPKARSACMRTRRYGTLARRRCGERTAGGADVVAADRTRHRERP